MFSGARHHADRCARHRAGRRRHPLHHAAGARSVTAITLAAVQFACSWDFAANIAKAKDMVRRAHAMSADIVLLPELFETPYFCQDQSADHFALARPFEGNTLIAEFAALAKELSVVLPLSFFERANLAHYNALAVID